MLPVANPVLTPAQDAFTRQFERGISQLVWTACPADLDTPVQGQ
jgi:hypothetical protein